MDIPNQLKTPLPVPRDGVPHPLPFFVTYPGKRWISPNQPLNTPLPVPRDGVPHPLPFFVTQVRGKNITRREDRTCAWRQQAREIFGMVGSPCTREKHYGLFPLCLMTSLKVGKKHNNSYPG